MGLPLRVILIPNGGEWSCRASHFQRERGLGSIAHEGQPVFGEPTVNESPHANSTVKLSPFGDRIANSCFASS
jgi:hypothetical protein